MQDVLLGTNPVLNGRSMLSRWVFSFWRYFLFCECMVSVVYGFVFGKKWYSRRFVRGYFINRTSPMFFCFMLATDICDYWLIFQFHALFYFIYAVLLLHNFFCFEFAYISKTPIYLLLWWNPSYDQRNILPSLIMISFCCYYDFPVTSPILFVVVYQSSFCS